MKDNWERMTTAIDLDHAALTDLIQPAFPHRRVVAAELMTGGLANTLYKIAINGSDQPFVVRLYTRDGAACAKDQVIFDLIHLRVPLPELLYADPTIQRGPVPYTIMRFVPGVLLREVLRDSDSSVQRAAGQAVGRVRAEMSNFTFDSGGFFGSHLSIVQPLAFDGDELRAYLGQCLFDRGGAARLGVERTQQLWALVNHNAALLDHVGSTNTLVHADFNGPNILMDQIDGAWQVAAVLDWEFACAGPALYDLGVLLRHDPMLESPFTAGVIQRFVDHGGVLPSDWRRMIKLLDLINLCDFLAKANGPTVIRDIVDLIDQTITHWPDLASTIA